MSKLDQIRALRERRFAKQVSSSPIAPEIIYGGGRGGGMSDIVKRTVKAAAKSHVTDKRVTDNSVTDKICVVCNEPFEAKRADATICSAACRMRKKRAAA